MPGTLYIVSTPIGNPDDITQRALRVLAEVDLIVCEERREGLRRMAAYGIDCPLEELNEHTERTRAGELAERLVRGESLALISDHGTPLLADPGRELVQSAIAGGAKVTAVPGASSILAALVVSGLAAAPFRFVGLLPAKREARTAALEHLARERSTWVILDAPYRLAPVLEGLRQTLGAERRAAVACNLTMPDEQIVRGTLGEIVKHFQEHPFKGEFVIVVQGTGEPKPGATSSRMGSRCRNKSGHKSAVTHPPAHTMHTNTVRRK